MGRIGGAFSRAWSNGGPEASQASDTGSIPVARSTKQLIIKRLRRVPTCAPPISSPPSIEPYHRATESRPQSRPDCLHVTLGRGQVRVSRHFLDRPRRRALASQDANRTCAARCERQHHEVLLLVQLDARGAIRRISGPAAAGYEDDSETIRIGRVVNIHQQRGSRIHAVDDVPFDRACAKVTVDSRNTERRTRVAGIITSPHGSVQVRARTWTGGFINGACVRMQSNRHGQALRMFSSSVRGASALPTSSAPR